MKVDGLVARVAAGQHALVTRHQALACGMTDRMIHGRVVDGRWVEVARGCTGCRRCVPGRGPGPVLSHRSAAVLWGISGFQPGRVEITVPPGRCTRNALARVHWSAVTGAAPACPSPNVLVHSAS